MPSLPSMFEKLPVVVLLVLYSGQTAAQTIDIQARTTDAVGEQKLASMRGSVYPLAPPDTAENIKFRVTEMSDGQFEDGTLWTIFDLEASDGDRLYDQSARFRSHKEAHKHFQQLLKMIGKIISRNPEIDEHGRVIGERALGLSEKNETGKLQYVVFGAAGTGFYKIAGSIWTTC